MFNNKILLLVMLVIFISCDNEETSYTNSNIDESLAERVVTAIATKSDEENRHDCWTINESEPADYADFEGSITLGREMEIPQSIDHMKTAWQHIQRNNLFPNVPNPVKTNKLYVRFLPKNQNQFLELERYDSNLDLFDFPLHYEFEPTSAQHDTYRDSSVSLETPNAQYTVVDHNYIFPSFVAYEILKELYMPDEDTTISEELVDAMEIIAENVANGKSPLIGLENKSAKWRPQGRVRVIDYSEGEPTHEQAVPVRGVHVMVRRGLKWSWGQTDQYGEFIVKKEFKKKVHYNVRWSNHEWYTILGSSVNRAWYFGPKKEGDWDLLIDGTKQAYYAQINRVAYHAFYGDNYGATRPMSNKPGNDRIFIRAFKRASKKDVLAYFYIRPPHAISVFDRKLENPDIPLYGEKYDKLYASLYKTVIHEFGHAMHRNKMLAEGNVQLSDLEARVIETWGRGVEVELIRTVYPEEHKRIVNTIHDCNNGNSIYTYLVKDLIHPNGIDYGMDPLNPSYQPDHAVFTLGDIDDALSGTHTWEEWNDKLRNGLSESEIMQLDAWFDYWDTVCD
ncbi:MAG: hypothetical protein AAF090_07885 [Bacteroidota bacterium]